MIKPTRLIVKKKSHDEIEIRLFSLKDNAIVRFFGGKEHRKSIGNFEWSRCYGKQKQLSFLCKWNWIHQTSDRQKWCSCKPTENWSNQKYATID